MILQVPLNIYFMGRYIYVEVGMRLIQDGVGVDALWKWRGLDDAPRMLFIFWQEVFLLEQMGELPCGAASSFKKMVSNMDIMYPDLLMTNILHWAANGYSWDARVIAAATRYIETINTENKDVIILGFLYRKRLIPEYEREKTKRIKDGLASMNIF